MVVEFAERRQTTFTFEAATQATQLLIGPYKSQDLNDPAVYIAAASKLFSSFPADFALRVVESLHISVKWLPAISELNEALVAEKARRDRIVANARWVLIEAAKRQAEKEAEEQLAASRGTAESRAAQVQALLKVRTMENAA